MKTPIEYLINPISKKSLSLKGTALYDEDNIQCAEIFEEEMRLDWISYNQYKELDNRVLREINKYDNWADAQSLGESPTILIDDFNINGQKIYANNPNFKNLNLDLEKLIKDKVVLDIGGSCIDTWRLLAGGAREVHHVEVSKNSQKFGLERIKVKLGADFNLTNKLFFHTSPAEYLPFQSDCFDFVFSRSSIHHTDRKLSLQEIHRVLKSEGAFLFFEPIQHVLINKIMHLSRKLRKVDRGTDNPLTTPDLILLNKLFKVMDYYPKSLLFNDMGIINRWFLKSTKGQPNVPVLFGRKSK